MCFFSKVSERDFSPLFIVSLAELASTQPWGISRVIRFSFPYRALPNRRTAFLHHDSIQLYSYPVLQRGLLLHSQNQRLGSRRCFDTVKTRCGHFDITFCASGGY